MAKAKCPFTRTEIAIITRLAEGKNSVEIARELRKSPHTIRTHLEHARMKVNVHRSTGIVGLALREGWIT